MTVGSTTAALAGTRTGGSLAHKLWRHMPRRPHEFLAEDFLTD